MDLSFGLIAYRRGVLDNKVKQPTVAELSCVFGLVPLPDLVSVRSQVYSVKSVDWVAWCDDIVQVGDANHSDYDNVFFKEHKG